MSRNVRACRWALRAAIGSSLLLAYSSGLAQTAPVPNLSGTWELIQIDNYPKKGDPKFPKMTLVIEHESSRVKVTEKRIKLGKEEVRTFVYNADGSGETNSGKIEVWRTEAPEFHSVTRANKNRLVTEYKLEWHLTTAHPVGVFGGRDRTDTASQLWAEWSVDASGTKLTLTTKALNLVSNADGPRNDFGTVKLKFLRI